jgi:hypothetical protein
MSAQQPCYLFYILKKKMIRHRQHVSSEAYFLSLRKESRSIKVNECEYMQEACNIPDFTTVQKRFSF